MKPLLAVAAALLGAMVAGCSTTGTLLAPPDRPRLDPPDSALTQRCPGPVALPAGEMSQADIERSWSADRRHLIACAGQKAILVDYIAARDNGLAGGSAK